MCGKRQAPCQRGISLFCIRVGNTLRSKLATCYSSARHKSLKERLAPSILCHIPRGNKEITFEYLELLVAWTYENPKGWFVELHEYVLQQTHYTDFVSRILWNWSLTRSLQSVDSVWDFLRTHWTDSLTSLRNCTAVVSSWDYCSLFPDWLTPQLLETLTIPDEEAGRRSLRTLHRLLKERTTWEQIKPALWMSRLLEQLESDSLSASFAAQCMTVILNQKYLTRAELVQYGPTLEFLAYQRILDDDDKTILSYTILFNTVVTSNPWQRSNYLDGQRLFGLWSTVLRRHVDQPEYHTAVTDLLQNSLVTIDAKVDPPRLQILSILLNNSPDCTHLLGMLETMVDQNPQAVAAHENLLTSLVNLSLREDKGQSKSAKQLVLQLIPAL